MGKRWFSSAWWEKTLNHCINLWCVKKEFKATCTLSNKDINVEYMGFGALKQHAEKQKHKGFASHLSKVEEEMDTHVKETEQKEQKSKKVMHEFFMKKNDKPKDDTETLQDEGNKTGDTQKEVWSIKQMVVRAEIIATLHFAAHSLPFSSSQSLAACYQQQFPDSLIARHVTFGAIKMSYMVSYGLGPYFRQMIIKDIIEGHSYFTLHFDGTVSAQTKKHMDLLVHYWSEREHIVKVKYLTSIMFGHATASRVVEEMLQTLEELALPLRLMLSLGMDGPNVNKSILSKFNSIKVKKGFKELITCPTSCIIHVCHSSFRKGLSKYGSNAAKLCISLFYFFSKLSCRHADLFEMEESLGLEELVLHCHVQSLAISCTCIGTPGTNQGGLEKVVY